nr:centrosomal protein of 120 kDa-like [Halyomorpha halys]
MDCYHTSKAQVVVEIKEGNGFTFLTSPVVVVASFNGIQLETKEMLLSNCPQFDSELIWQTDTKYLRRLRTANTALKLECFTFFNNHKQN